MVEFEIKIIFWQPFSLSIGVFANFWPMFLLLNEIICVDTFQFIKSLKVIFALYAIKKKKNIP